jgi:outer membrane protein TolC
VTAQWPLFDGWLTRSKVEQALIDVKQATLLEERAVKDIALELTNAFLALQEAVGQLRAAETEIAYYTLHFATVQDRFRKGMASSLDVNDAEIKQKIALFNKTQALFDYSIAKSDFEKATGGKK